MTLGPKIMITARARSGVVALMSALALAATAAAPAQAAAPTAAAQPTFALSSGETTGSRLLRGNPGDRLQGAVSVHNISRRRITVRLQPADIRNATNGNADYVTTELTQAGRWLKLARTRVSLAPRATQRVGFTVSVPADASGASHYAGVVAVDAKELATAKAPRKNAKAAGFTISRINRQALPLTIRLPGPLTRSLEVRGVELDVQASGAGLVLGLRPNGSVLTQNAAVKLRVSRGDRTVLTDETTLGQLFPGSELDYRVAWKGRPTEGSYRVTGVIRPQDAAPVFIDRNISFTPDNAKEFERETPPDDTAAATNTLPLWVWLALGLAVALLTGLSVAVLKLKRRAAALTG